MSLKELFLGTNQALSDLSSPGGSRKDKEAIVRYLENNFKLLNIIRHNKVDPGTVHHVYREQTRIKIALEKLYAGWEFETLQVVSTSIHELIDLLDKGLLEVHSVAKRIRQLLSQTDGFNNFHQEKQSLESWVEKQISDYSNRSFIRTSAYGLKDRKQQLMALADDVIQLVSRICSKRVPVCPSVERIEKCFASIDELKIESDYVKQLKLWAQTEVNIFLNNEDEEVDSSDDYSDCDYGAEDHSPSYISCSSEFIDDSSDDEDEDFETPSFQSGHNCPSNQNSVHDDIVHHAEHTSRSSNSCLPCFELSQLESLCPKKVSSEMPSLAQLNFEEISFSPVNEILNPRIISSTEISKADVSHGSVGGTDSPIHVVSEFSDAISLHSKTSEHNNLDLEILSEGILSDMSFEISDVLSSTIVKSSSVVAYDIDYVESDCLTIVKSSENDNLDVAIMDASSDQPVVSVDAAFNNSDVDALGTALDTCNHMFVIDSLNNNVSDVNADLVSNESPKLPPKPLTNDTVSDHAFGKIILEFLGSYKTFSTVFRNIQHVYRFAIRNLFGKNILFNIDVDVLLGLVKQKR